MTRKPAPPDHSETMTLPVTLPPESSGNPPHRRTGPTFGHVVEGDVTHCQDGNNLADAPTRFLVRWS